MVVTPFAARHHLGSGGRPLALVGLDAVIATRPLPRVEIEYLRPLLVGLASVDASPLAVSHPENGWTALRDSREHDVGRAVTRL